MSSLSSEDEPGTSLSGSLKGLLVFVLVVTLPILFGWWFLNRTIRKRLRPRLAMCGSMSHATATAASNRKPCRSGHDGCRGSMSRSFRLGGSAARRNSEPDPAPRQPFGLHVGRNRPLASSRASRPARAGLRLLEAKPGKQRSDSSRRLRRQTNQISVREVMTRSMMP